MRIGIDFDNTIASYDRLLADLAVEQGLVAERPTGGKRAIRDLVREGEDGEIAWQRLQALAFGPRIGGAVMMEGLEPFLTQCRRRDVAVFVVSHKTRFAAKDRDGIDLHEATLGWMEGKGLLSRNGVKSLTTGCSSSPREARRRPGFAMHPLRRRPRGGL